MIEVKILRKKDLVVGFKINGHALSRSELNKTGNEYDLVCNSVSVLSQSTLIGIVEVLKLRCKYEMKDGYLNLDASNLKDEEIDDCQSLFLTFEKSLESLIKSIEMSFGKKKCSEYISLLKEEVQ